MSDRIKYLGLHTACHIFPCLCALPDHRQVEGQSLRLARFHLFQVKWSEGLIGLSPVNFIVDKSLITRTSLDKRSSHSCLSRLSVFAGVGLKMFLRLSLCLYLGLLVSPSSQTCSFKDDYQELVEVGGCLETETN